MKPITHDDQQKIWDREHKTPTVLHQMNQSDPSSGVVKFWDFFKKNLNKNSGEVSALEMGCGKGRNVIWLAQQGVHVTGFDFSPTAIAVAKDRAKKSEVENKTNFLVQDATKIWPFPDDHFDFVVDCFASTDIESQEGRANAVREFFRVLKPGGFLFAYLLSTDDEFHKEMIKKFPAHEKNAFLHTTGKFEKVFDEEEISDIYKAFRLVNQERISKNATFLGKEYPCRHFWLVLQKS